MLISCICLFFCTSFIYAADIGSASADNSSYVSSDDVIDILPNATVDETPNQDTCDMTNSTDLAVVKHGPHHINKTYFSHDFPRHDFEIGSHYSHKIQHNHSDFKIKDDSKIKLDEDGAADYKIESEFTLDGSQAMANIEKTRINTDIVNGLCLNDKCSSCNVDQCSKVTKESEFCVCGKANCHHHGLHECLDNIMGTGNHIDEDSACLCNQYTQTNVIGDVVVKSRNINKEKGISDVSILNHNVTRGYHTHQNIDFFNGLTNSAYGMFLQSGYIGLDIDSLHSQDLDIKDYNLEYYMFTNPDIIVKRANTPILAKADTLIFNKNINNFLKTFDGKITIHRITLNNSFLTDAKINESFASKSIIEDNYVSLNTATFLQKTVSLKDVKPITFIMAKQSCRTPPSDLSDNENAAATICFGGYEDV